MKNLFYCLTFFFCLYSATGQTLSYQNQVNIYKRALSFNDYSTAALALHSIIEMDNANSDWLDTLAFLYFEQRQYVSAALAAQEAVENDPKDVMMLELAGTSFENIGLNDKALGFYEKLNAINPSSSFVYKIAFLQYRLRRLDESRKSCNEILNDPSASEKTLVFGKKDKTTQLVKMNAAAYRILALIEYEQQNDQIAIMYFEKALEISPEFEVVSDAIETLKKK